MTEAYYQLITAFRESHSGDWWGSCMGWMFALADYMVESGLEVPVDWEFHQSPFGADKDAYEYLELEAIAPDIESMKKFGRVLWRLHDKLKFLGRDY